MVEGDVALVLFRDRQPTEFHDLVSTSASPLFDVTRCLNGLKNLGQLPKSPCCGDNGILVVLYGPRENLKNLDVAGAIISLFDYYKATLVAANAESLKEATGTLFHPLHFAAHLGWC